ncbi:HNH endonuclease [Phaeodactylibacter xiamenensis]|uniref:HNH endonuclease n=1 Tax=Phaeodactylibacter xiamenensis TaxID=1524460 RepID=UPI003BABEDB8
MQGLLEKFQSLGRYKDSAPHKPLLVLALLDWTETLKLEENRIPINSGLFERFEYYWDELHGNKGSKRIHYPLLYLKSDGLGWQVIVNGGQLSEEKSKTYLEKQGATGQFSEEVWSFLQKQEHRDLVRLAIMETYFPEKQAVIFPSHKPYSLESYELEFFEEPMAKYQSKMVYQSGFVRSSLFKIRLLGLYKNTCAMSRMHVDPPKSLLQACHIEPHAVAGNDRVTNGIVLCANLHAAFDYGYVGISKDYHIMVNHKLFEESASDYSLKQLEGKKLWLPEQERFWPGQEGLGWHRRKFFYQDRN